MTLGRLLTSNEDLLKEIHSEMLHSEVWVLKNKGFLGTIMDIIDGEYFKVVDRKEREWKVSCFEIRGLSESGIPSSRYATSYQSS